ncbi:GNAT family N-acetyltransferase [Lacticaseibacillus kribbianus]|uniref:GNAT family N-acetyltransferase n=1 Tax=Lacticaseibacillus kribbianus TaxID=2926292 RepID=UPI001CD6E8BD|nr:N-acetyltransferase [Lacticaseibacillus kribbianus]
MAHFEKYHPLLSAHYQLDWPTLFRLKDVHALRADATQAALSGRALDATIEDTARYVNQSMQLVMGDRSLLYGIGDRATGAFCGSICLWQFDAEKTEAQLRFEVLERTPAAVMAEVLPRVAGFAFFELGLKRLRVVLPPETAAAQSVLPPETAAAEPAATNAAATTADQTATEPEATTPADLPAANAAARALLAANHFVAVDATTLVLTRDTVADDPAFRF